MGLVTWSSPVMQTDDPGPYWELGRARRYRRIKLGLYGVALASSVAQNAWLALSGTSAKWQQNIARRVPDQRLATPAYLAMAHGARWLTGLPIAFVSGHLIERTFGLTKRGSGSWLTEQIKAAALGMVLTVPLTAAAFNVIQRRPRDLVASALRRFRTLGGLGRRGWGQSSSHRCLTGSRHWMTPI